MTLGSKIPFRIQQNYFLFKDTFDSFLAKLEVLSDSQVIVNSIRILIVGLALLMGYIQTPIEKKDLSSVEDSVAIDKGIKPIIEQIN